MNQDLDSYSLEQLSQLKQQEEGKLNQVSWRPVFRCHSMYHQTNTRLRLQVTQHYSQLKQAQIRFQNSKETLATMKPETAGAEVMVPLTQSLYVSGKVKDPTKVIIEVRLT